MKKWLKFFFLSFFSDKTAKEATKRGYTNMFLGLLLTFAFLWLGVVGGELLPFETHYKNAPDFAATVHRVLADPDGNRIEIKIQDGNLMAHKQGTEYAEALLVNTFKSEEDRQVYSVNGYDVVVDMRPADTLAEIEAYCISNDGQELEISYEEYLTLSPVAQRNFDFQLRYTGNALVLDDAQVEIYKSYVIGLGEDQKAEIEKLDKDLAESRVTKNEYDRSVYQLYFVAYYPSIAEYEGTSKVPLLRNYYYHQYITTGETKYLFIFDDYLVASFETKSGDGHAFYGFYNNMEEGAYISGSAEDVTTLADQFIKAAFHAMAPITAYAHGMNVFSLIPFIALMPLVVALLAYSLLKLRGVDSIKTFGNVAKIVGSYIWFAGLLSALLTVAMSFFMLSSAITMLPIILFFLILMVRSILFAVNEIRAFKKQLTESPSQMED